MEKVEMKRRSQAKGNMRRFLKNRAAVAGMIILGLLILGAVFANVLTPYSFDKQDLVNRFQFPSFKHFLGTDEFGRDMLTRILFGARISLFVGILSVAIGCLLGGAMGAFAAYYGGKTDDLIMRFLDIWHSIPSMLLAISLASAMGPGIMNAIIAIGLTAIPTYARVVRASVMTIINQEYIEAARCLGVNTRRIIWKHIIPNALAPIIVQASLGVATAIITTASLSFIGLGVQPPEAEWGSMLSKGRQYIRNYWHLVTFPGVFIMLAVMSLNLIGDGLRDALDPRLKR